MNASLEYVQADSSHTMKIKISANAMSECPGSDGSLEAHFRGGYTRVAGKVHDDPLATCTKAN